MNAARGGAGSAALAVRHDGYAALHTPDDRVSTGVLGTLHYAPGAVDIAVDNLVDS